MQNGFLNRVNSSQVIANDGAFPSQQIYLTHPLCPEHQWVPCGPSVMMQCSRFERTCSKRSTVSESFIYLINKPILLPRAEKLSADAPPLVQTQPWLVGFCCTPPISSWTPLGGLPLRLPARTIQPLLSFQMRTIGKNTLARSVQ